MPTLHDPYADADHLRWAVTFLALIAMMMMYSYVISRLPKIWKFRALKSAEMFVAAFMLSLIFTTVPLPFQTLQPYVKAPAYTCPVGCVNKDYHLWDSISRVCGAEKYEIKNYRDYGLSSHVRKSTEDAYFRLGNDAVQMRCQSGMTEQPGCKIEWIERDFYHQ